jgi:CubicO group peptidase (beta-lactamase class C family)
MNKKTKGGRIALLAVVSFCVLALLALLLPSTIHSPEDASQRFGGGGEEPLSAPAYWPTEEWRSSTPEEEGIDSEMLAEGLQTIRDENIHIHSLLIIRNGSVVLDAYFYPYDGKTVHELASVTKSLMTTLIGIAADQGKLDLDEPIVSFFTDRAVANRDPLKEKITVRHLARMSSGLELTVPGDAEGTVQEMRVSQDWVQFALNRKVVSEPGTRFVYDNCGMHILSAILQEATGMTALDFGRENLFEPLGIREVIWPADPQGFSRGWGDVYLHPHDAAKIGYLWLNKGTWDGEQIVSSQWVEESVKPQIKTDGDDYYGYGWWVETTGGHWIYLAQGRGGQYIIVAPYLDMVVVATGGGFDFDEIEQLIVPAFVDMENPLPANPEGIARLNAALEAISEPPKPEPVPPLPGKALEISGKTFVFEENPLEVKTLRLDFNNSDEARILITFADDTSPSSGMVGLDGIYRISPGQNNLPAGYRGRWADDQTFVLEVEEIANIDSFTVKHRFEGDRVVMEVEERTTGIKITFGGRLENP